MVIKSDGHATFHNFSKDWQQRNWSVILGWFFINGSDISGRLLRWNLICMQRMVERFRGYILAEVEMEYRRGQLRSIKVAQTLGNLINIKCYLLNVSVGFKWVWVITGR